MKKKLSRALRLNRETLRILSAPHLRHVAGGIKESDGCESGALRCGGGGGAGGGGGPANPWENEPDPEPRDSRGFLIEC